MPRVLIPVTQVTNAGVAPPAQVNSDAVNDHAIAFNDGLVMIEIVSSDAAARTVTFQTPATVGDLAIADLDVAVPAGATRLVGPLSPALFNQPDGSVNVDVAVSTTLKFRAYRVSA